METKNPGVRNKILMIWNSIWYALHVALQYSVWTYARNVASFWRPDRSTDDFAEFCSHMEHEKIRIFADISNDATGQNNENPTLLKQGGVLANKFAQIAKF